MRAFWSCAAAAVKLRTRIFAQLPDMSVSRQGIVRMDEVEQLIEAFRARGASGAASKLDLLMDLELLQDTRIVPFLLQVMSDTAEAPEVRNHVVKWLRNRRLPARDREAVALVMIEVLGVDS